MRHETSYLVGKRHFKRWSFIKASAEVFTCSYDTVWSRCLQINSIYHLRMTHHITNRRSSVHEECMCKSMKGNTFNWLEKVLYTIMWLLCAFSLVVHCDLIKDTHTHTDDVKSMSRLVLLFLYPKNPSINHLNFYCIKQIDYIFLCVCTVL